MIDTDNWKKEYFRLRATNNQEDINKSFELKLQHLPKYLYKYREFCIEHKARLRNELSGLIHLSKIENFNDPYDSKAILKESRRIYLELSKDHIRHEMSYYFSPEIINNVFSKENWYEKMIALGLQKENPLSKEVAKAGDEFLDKIKKPLLNITSDFNKILEEGIRVACFTERYNNIPMWYHYAGRFRGYCIEYDTSHIKDTLYAKRLMPVNYVTKLREVAPDFEKYYNESYTKSIKNVIDEYITTKLMDWSYENEWRLVLSIKMINELENNVQIIKNTNGCEIMFAKPARILVSEKMNAQDLLEIKKECKRFDVKMCLLELSESGPVIKE